MAAFSDLVISVDELWLKGANRRHYLKAATDHISAVIKAYHQDKFTFKIDSQRLYYHSPTPFTEELIDALVLIPGLAYVSPCRVIKRNPNQDFENVYQEILDELKYFENTPKTFRGTVTRVDKHFKLTSVEVAREIGHRVITRFPKAKVELKRPELIIDVRILEKHVSLSTLTRKGIGGLPWGSTGSAVTMLSGGFDSPVASVLMAKRGIKQAFVFFHSYPYVGREVLTKIKKLASTLAKYQKQSHLYIVPFGDIQNEISKKCREEYRTLFFRRFMIEVSNLICDKIKAEAVITGDCVGQVSSQTMQNLHLMDKVSQRIILRPLIGFTKLEILNAAKEIGTHDISVIPHDDACSLFAPKSPVIIPNTEYWNYADKDFSMGQELQNAFKKIECFSVNLKGEIYKKDFFSFDS
jgi:thiamine biosynthesis protein ThiI